MKSTLLFYPTSIVHFRSLDTFRLGLSNWNIKCLLNPRWPWISKIEKSTWATVHTIHDFIPERALDDVCAVILFSAQPMVTTCHLIEQATLKSIPVIAIEEVYQMMLEQGYVNEYYVPVDHFFVSSNYEREKFLEIGYPQESIEAMGCMFFQCQESIPASEIRQKIGLKGNKPIATLSLAYLTPSGETLDIRKKLLKLVNEGLPQEYDLIVKPHPAEKDPNYVSFIKKYAPRAHVVDPYVSIHLILKVTSVLLNRGNSQVVIEALKQEIFVISIPLGRPTFFDELLTEILVREPQDIPRVLKRFQLTPHEKLYEPIFKKYFDISSEKAKENIFSGIHQIIEKKQLNHPYERLMEVTLFWFWMGFESQACRLLDQMKKRWPEKILLLKKLEMFLDDRLTEEDFFNMCRSFSRRTTQGIVQALWIKHLFLKNKGISLKISRLLEPFPPRMNREYYFIYVHMLECLKYKNKIFLTLLYNYVRLKYMLYFKVKGIFFETKMVCSLHILKELFF